MTNGKPIPENEKYIQFKHFIFSHEQIQIEQQHQINQLQHQIGGNRRLVLGHMECCSHIRQLVAVFQDLQQVD